MTEGDPGGFSRPDGKTQRDWERRWGQLTQEKGSIASLFPPDKSHRQVTCLVNTLCRGGITRIPVLCERATEGVMPRRIGPKGREAVGLIVSFFTGLPEGSAPKS